MSKRLTVAAVAKKIAVPVKEWAGNCYYIAGLMVDAGLVPQGKLRYGHWLGPVEPGTMFSCKGPIIQHGWVEVMGEGHEVIVDPTRWVFEGKKPYIYNAPDFKGYYDRGGNGLLMSFALDRNVPENDLKKAQHKLPGGKTGRAMRVLLGNYHGDTVCVMQAHYIATQPLEFLGPHATAIYKWLGARKLSALVPLDNWNYITEG